MAFQAVITEIFNSRVTNAYPQYILDAPGTLKTGSPINSESGGCHDPVRRMMYCPVGGGHRDWMPNLVFAIHIPTNLVTTGWTVISDASRWLPEFAANGLNGGEWPHPEFPPSINPNAEVYSDGKIPARHTYGNLCCSPVRNEIVIYGGSKWASGNGDRRLWRFLLNPGATQYTYQPGTTGLGTHDGGPAHGTFHAEYDAGTDSFWARDATAGFVNYNFAAQAWTKHSGTLGSPGGRYTAAFDTVRGVYYMYRFNTVTGLPDDFQSFQTHPDAFNQAKGPFILSGTDVTTQLSRRGAGFGYSPGIDRLVLWPGGQEVVLIHPVTHEAEIITATGYDPGPQAHHGTWGRFARFGDYEFICCNEGGNNMFQLVLSDDSLPGSTGTSVDLVMQHASFTPTVATSVAEYRYGVATVETKVFGAQQNRVRITDIPDGAHVAQAGAYDGLGALIGTLITKDFDVPLPVASVDEPAVHSVVVGSSASVQEVTVPGGVANLAMIAYTSGRIADNTVSSVTFDGDALTAKAFIGSGSAGSTNGRFLAAHYLLNPAVKTADVVATVATGASTSVVEGVVFVRNVHQTTPFGAAVTAANAGGSTSSTVTVPSAVNDLVISAVTTGTSGQVPGTGQTTLYVNAAAAGLNSVRQGVSTLPGLVTETAMPWTFTGASGISTVQIGFAIKGAGTPDPPDEDPVDRVVATAIAVTVGATLDIDVTYTTTAYPFDTEAVTLYQVHLVDVNGTVVGTFHENTTQTAGVQARDLPLPDGFGTPYRVRTRERNAATGTIIKEFFSAPFAVDPAGGPVSILVPTVVTYTPIPVQGGPDGLRVSWTMASAEFEQEIDVASYTAIRVNVGALPPRVVSPTTTEVVFPRVLPGPYPIQVGRYRMETDEFLQFVGISIRHGNREVSL